MGTGHHKCFQVHRSWSLKLGQSPPAYAASSTSLHCDVQALPSLYMLGCRKSWKAGLESAIPSEEATPASHFGIGTGICLRAKDHIL